MQDYTEQVSEAELRMAYQDTALRRVLNWPYERAMTIPNMQRIVARIAANNAATSRRAAAAHAQLRLI